MPDVLEGVRGSSKDLNCLHVGGHLRFLWGRRKLVAGAINHGETLTSPPATLGASSVCLSCVSRAHASLSVDVWQLYLKHRPCRRQEPCLPQSANKCWLQKWLLEKGPGKCFVM